MSKSATATKAPRAPRKGKSAPTIVDHVDASLASMVAPDVAAATPATDTGRKIEKDRPKQNGVTRPSEGGMCRAVWDLCDALGDASNPPTVAAVKAAAPSTLNATNVQIEYYQWRKFHGIRGRIKAAVTATPEA